MWDNSLIRIRLLKFHQNEEYHNEWRLDDWNQNMNDIIFETE